MSYKDYIISSLRSLYTKYKIADNAVSKRLLMHRIKCYLSDLNRIKYEENSNFVYSSSNDV